VFYFTSGSIGLGNVPIRFSVRVATNVQHNCRVGKPTNQKQEQQSMLIHGDLFSVSHCIANVQSYMLSNTPNLDRKPAGENLKKCWV